MKQFRTVERVVKEFTASYNAIIDGLNSPEDKYPIPHLTVDLRKEHHDYCEGAIGVIVADGGTMCSILNGYDGWEQFDKFTTLLEKNGLCMEPYNSCIFGIYEA